MPNNFRLGDITLGCADGENEAKEDWFVNLFYDGNGKVNELLSSKSKFIISGRKGTGKTILAKYIERKCQDKHILTAVLNKENFSMQYIIEKGSECLSSIELSHFLKYCILIQIAELLINNRRKMTQALKENKKFSFTLLKKLLLCKFKTQALKKLYFDIYPNGVYKTMSLEEETGAEGEKSITRHSVKLSTYYKNKYIKRNVIPN